jgi:hypothetical protein
MIEALEDPHLALHTRSLPSIVFLVIAFKVTLRPTPWDTEWAGAEVRADTGVAGDVHGVRTLIYSKVGRVGVALEVGAGMRRGA